MLCGEVLVCLLCSLLVAGRSAPRRIMDGEETTIEEHPYMAVCERWGKLECGATIIKETWALTASHCVRGDEQQGELILRVGSSTRESGGSVIAVDRSVKYATRRPNDIAVLHVQQEFPIGPKVQMVALAQYYLVGCHNGSVLGWGRQSVVDNSPTTLRKTTLLLLDPSECKNAIDFDFEEYVDTFYCARPKHVGNDVCWGDSGGPFVKGDMQHGILSLGTCSGSATTRIVLTNVYHYREWIESVTSE